jgi:tetratricopeptide (TPR) repeat protein
VSLWPDDKNITEALSYAYDNHLHELVARICLGMHLFWRDYGRAKQTEMYVAWGIAAAEEYAATAQSEDAYRALATLRLAHARFLRLTGKLDEAERLAREALSTFKGAGHLHGTGAAHVVLANIARDNGEYEQARVSLREALGIYQSNEALDVGGQGLALCFLGQASQRLGEIEVSDHELQQSIEISERINDQWCLGLARLLLGNNLKQRGRFEEAGALYRDVLEFYQFVDSRRSIGVALSSLGEIALSLGNLAEAEHYLLESIEARRESRDLRGEGVDLTFLGGLGAIQERFAESSDYFMEALKIWNEVHDPRGQGWVLAEQARVALGQGNLDDADALLARSLELRRKVGDKRGITTNLCISAEIALWRGEVVLADDQLRQAEALANEVKDRPIEAHIKLVRGLAAAARGNPDRAEACYRASLAIASELGIRREMAQAQELLGRLLVERQDLFEGRQLLAQAEENYSHLGVPAAARVREIMVELGCAAGD